MTTRCPECDSHVVTKLEGEWENKDVSYEVYRCEECGYEFRVYDT